MFTPHRKVHKCFIAVVELPSYCPAVLFFFSSMFCTCETSEVFALVPVAVETFSKAVWELCVI